jgi:putative flippase GtrA
VPSRAHADAAPEPPAAPAPAERGAVAELADVAWALVRRVHLGTREPANWVQLFKFGLVGASGYVVNLLVYVALLDGADLHYRLAATGSFLVAVSNNYLLNRLWTFRHHRGHFGYQGLRFFVVSVLVYLGNLAILTLLVEVGLGKIVSQALAIVLVTPANFIGNKLWSFRRRH